MIDDCSIEVDADVSDTDSSELNEGAVGGNQIDSPQYEPDETRRLSFPRDWQDYHTQTPEDMSAAGFFHENSSHGKVRCYTCGVRVWKWKPGDLPLERHIKANKSCPFARQALGDVEITRIFKSMKDVGAEEAKSKLNEVGYKDDAISKALEQVTCKGSETVNHTDITNASEDLRKSKRGASGTINNLPDTICLGCSVNERTIMFLPCSCTASCSSCAPTVQNCFLCGRDVSERMTVFIS